MQSGNEDIQRALNDLSAQVVELGVRLRASTMFAHLVTDILARNIGYDLEGYKKYVLERMRKDPDSFAPPSVFPIFKAHFEQLILNTDISAEIVPLKK